MRAPIGIGEYLRRSARRYPQNAAIIDQGVTFTHAQFEERSGRLAAALVEAGVAPGDRVAVVMENRHEALETFAAALRGGFVHVPLSSRLTSAETAELINDCGASTVITDADNSDKVRSVEGDLVDVERTITSGKAEGNWLGFEEVLDSAAGPVEVLAGPDSRAAIVYTSGTTSHAKGVVTGHRQIATQSLGAIIPEFRLRSSSRFLALYPHNSAASLYCFYIPTWVMGGAIVIDDVRAFTASRFLDNVERYSVTHTMAVPTMLVRILRHVEEHGVEASLSSLELISYGSAPISPTVLEGLLKAFGPIFAQVYGMTESTGVVTMLRAEEHAAGLEPGSPRLRSCGQAVPGAVVEVAADDGSRCAPNELGELRYRTEALMDEYWGAPDLTADSLRDGWLYSGDLGKEDDEGWLYIVDRKKDLIISGGQNIASKEVEDVLHTHVAVSEAAVIGVPDEEWGESVHAVIVRRDDSVSEEQILEWVRDKLARFKQPKSVEFVAEMPLTSIGKVSKPELRRRFTAEAETAEAKG